MSVLAYTGQAREFVEEHYNFKFPRDYNDMVFYDTLNECYAFSDGMTFCRDKLTFVVDVLEIPILSKSVVLIRNSNRED